MPLFCLGCALIFGGIGIGLGRSGRVRDMWLGFGMAVIALLPLLSEPLVVRLTNTAVVVRYALRRHLIPYPEIRNVRLRNEPGGRGGEQAFVYVDRATGKPVKLVNFRGGSLALCTAISRAWEAQRPKD